MKDTLQGKALTTPGGNGINAEGELKGPDIIPIDTRPPGTPPRTERPGRGLD